MQSGLWLLQQALNFLRTSVTNAALHSHIDNSVQNLLSVNAVLRSLNIQVSRRCRRLRYRLLRRSKSMQTCVKFCSPSLVFGTLGCSQLHASRTQSSSGDWEVSPDWPVNVEWAWPMQKAGEKKSDIGKGLWGFLASFGDFPLLISFLNHFYLFLSFRILPHRPVRRRSRERGGYPRRRSCSKSTSTSCEAKHASSSWKLRPVSKMSADAGWHFFTHGGKKIACFWKGGTNGGT